MKLWLPPWSQRARRTLLVALTTFVASGLVLAFVGTTTGCGGKDCSGPNKASTASLNGCINCLNDGGGCRGGNNYLYENDRTCRCTSSGPGTPGFRSLVGPE